MNILKLSDLQLLFTNLRSRGYSLIGPTLRDGAIVYDEITGVDDLPKGWTDKQEAASYSLMPRGDDALFGFVVSPYAWKRFLFPPRLKLFSMERVGKAFRVSSDGKGNGDGVPRYAFIGVRSCELSAMEIQDKVFAQGEYADPTYKKLRENAFVIAVNCTAAGGTCFCTSMNTGPKANSGFDLALTEIIADGAHYFVVEVGSERGESLLQETPHEEAGEIDRSRVETAVGHAAGTMGRMLDTRDLQKSIAARFDHPEWDDVAKRCLLCANCTMVCPTCFCSTIEDVTDLTGDHAERWRRWDSCFTMDFTKIAGGNIRQSSKARYRQWMSHKLSFWMDQFGTYGCVGCGRCITWCPVGIDITVEAETIRSATTVTSSGGTA